MIIFRPALGDSYKVHLHRLSVFDRFAGTSIKRTLVIKGTPKPITKEELLEKIPDAVHVILPKRGTPPEYPG